jgi:uncharacterized protein with PhoU and TrkA domain
MYLNTTKDKKLGMKNKILEKIMPKWKKVEFEEIEYEPRSIKDILIEMKNISELIVDLAYSALLFNNKEIAEEVKYLEVKMDTLNYDIRLIAMLAARTKEDAEKLSGILQIAEAAETISNAAGDIVKLLSIKLTHPILPRLIKRSDETIKKLTIEEKSAANNKTIEQLRIASETGVRIITIRRGKQWIHTPRKNEVLKAGDIIIGIGPQEGLERLTKLFEGKIEVL